jgi:dTDP-4-dehydrorhamnose 3,5-epimerase
MKIIETKIKDLLILEPHIYHDSRGWFSEKYNQQVFNSILIQYNQPIAHFVQDNYSLSHKNVLRGLHYQSMPYSQAKLVQVIQGSIWDVAVDLRKESLTFGQWVGIELSALNNKQIWIPAGFAHGFLSLQNNTILSYKTTNHYSTDNEFCIHWDDPDLNINWPIESSANIQQSQKDQMAQSLKSFLSISDL